jgi:hypothetical protein
MAAILRDILDTHFGVKGDPGHGDPFEHVIGVGEGDGSRVAEHVDDYLYGKDE